VNSGGLECSFYTWQMSQPKCVPFQANCQETPAHGTVVSAPKEAINISKNNGIDRILVQPFLCQGVAKMPGFARYIGIDYFAV